MPPPLPPLPPIFTTTSLKVLSRTSPAPISFLYAALELIDAHIGLHSPKRANLSWSLRNDIDYFIDILPSMEEPVIEEETQTSSKDEPRLGRRSSHLTLTRRPTPALDFLLLFSSALPELPELLESLIENLTYSKTHHPFPGSPSPTATLQTAAFTLDADAYAYLCLVDGYTLSFIATTLALAAPDPVHRIKMLTGQVGTRLMGLVGGGLEWEEEEMERMVVAQRLKEEK